MLHKNTYTTLKKFGAIPLRHQNLLSVLEGYKRPNDKIRDWVKKGVLISLAKGIYVVSEDIVERKPDPRLVANILYGPSYVSLEYALSFYQAIPELVTEVSSVTTQRSRSMKNGLGRFSYTHLPLPYYSYGIQLEAVDDGAFVLIATPEKALFDTVVCTRKLLLRSTADVRHWIDDMRLDEDWLASLNRERMYKLLREAPKKESLRKIIQILGVYVS